MMIDIESGIPVQAGLALTVMRMIPTTTRTKQAGSFQVTVTKCFVPVIVLLFIVRYCNGFGLPT